jgi:hypothetical protein
VSLQTRHARSGDVRILSVAAAVAVVCACGTADASHVRTVSERDKGTTIAVARGTHLRLVLHNTYWQIAKPSDTTVVRPDGRPEVAPGRHCLPGVGCGTVVERFIAVGTGRAQLRAHRTTCGEALRCTGGRGRYSVTIHVTG